MKKLDNKQIPQFIALCVLTVGLAGYLVWHFAAPSRVSAGTRALAAPKVAVLAPAAAAGQTPAPGIGVKPGSMAADVKPGDAKPGDAKPGDAKPGDASATVAVADGEAPPPSPTMHDPFAVGYVAPAGQSATPVKPAAAPGLPKMPALPKQTAPLVRTASVTGLDPLPISFPGAPALPAGLSTFPARPSAAAPIAPAAPALPIAPAAPAWTVTGVLQGATGKVAILRSGDARRIVHTGEFVDSTYRVTGVTRTSVILRHGARFYKLILGGTKAVPTKPISEPALPVSAPQSIPHQAAVMDSAIIPVYHLAQPQAPLTSLHQPGPGMNLAAEKLSVPRPAQKTSTARTASPARVAHEIALGLRLLDGSVPEPIN